MKHLIAPSLLSADFGHLADDIEMVNMSQADWFHIDIMDGNFVPNLSFGFPVLKAIQKIATKPLDMHLMILDPDRYIPAFRDHGADYITVHYEACTHLHRTLQLIRSTGAKAGVALNPHTPVQLLADILPEVDLVLIMSVNPGFGGQKFIGHSLEKIKTLAALIQQSGSAAVIEVDGGVGPDNVRSLVEASAQVLVAGNAVFAANDPLKAIEELKR